MDLIELGSALGDFFEQGAGPSHDELDHAVARADLATGDPKRAGVLPIGKTKRIRQVLTYATDHNPAAGIDLAKQVVALLRADGAFVPTADAYAGTEKIAGLRRAFAALGYDLDASGAIRPLVIDNLSGTELTEALTSYVRRINLNPSDAPLQVGTGKELNEAVARHVLEQKFGGYPTSGNAGSFPVTLASAFSALGLTVAPQAIASSLDPDPHKAVQQCIFQLGCAVNRLRNEAGTGHGRPGLPQKTAPLTPAEARLVARATALIAGALLDKL
jgi:hypothetical protein